MSEFLTHLIERAAGQAPMLQRRPRALFEPVEPDAAAPALLEAGHEPIAASPRPVMPTPLARNEAQAKPLTPQPVLPTTNGLPQPLPATVPQALLKERGRVLQPEALQPLVRHTELPHIGETGPGRDAEQISTVVDSGKPALPTAAPATPMSKARRLKAAAEPAHEPAQRERRRQPGDGAAVRAASSHAAERRDLPPPPPMTVPRRPAAAAVLMAKAQTAPRAEFAATAPPPAPVQISIGRVEVRAHTAAEPRPRAAAPAAPRLKLDDYLRQRGGGGS